MAQLSSGATEVTLPPQKRRMEGRTRCKANSVEFLKGKGYFKQWMGRCMIFGGTVRKQDRDL